MILIVWLVGLLSFIQPKPLLQLSTHFKYFDTLSLEESFADSLTIVYRGVRLELNLKLNPDFESENNIEFLTGNVKYIPDSLVRLTRSLFGFEGSITFGSLNFGPIFIESGRIWGASSSMIVYNIDDVMHHGRGGGNVFSKRQSGGGPITIKQIEWIVLSAMSNVLQQSFNNNFTTPTPRVIDIPPPVIITTPLPTTTVPLPTNPSPTPLPPKIAQPPSRAPLPPKKQIPTDATQPSQKKQIPTNTTQLPPPPPKKQIPTDATQPSQKKQIPTNTTPPPLKKQIPPTSTQVITPITQVTAQPTPIVTPEIKPACRVALLADKQFAEEHKNEAGGGVGFMKGIMNEVSGFYEKQLGLSFPVSFTFVQSESGGNDKSKLSKLPKSPQALVEYLNSELSIDGLDESEFCVGLTFSTVDLEAKAVGAAFIGVNCQVGLNMAVVSTKTDGRRLTRNEMVSVTMHEIAHMLGSDHDTPGVGCATGQPTTEFVMFPTVLQQSRNSFVLSKCSLNSIKNNLAKKVSQCFDGQARTARSVTKIVGPKFVIDF